MKRSSLALLLLASASHWGCAPDLTTTPAQKVITAQFDPTAVPPVVPLPTDLAKDAKTGLLNIPDAPGASPAQLEFNQYLRTLDGFPQSTPVTAAFSDAIDPATLTQTPSDAGGSVAFIDLTAMQPLTKSDYDVKLADDKKTIQIVPHLALNGVPSNQPLKLGHTYMAIVFGGDDKQGVKGADGTKVVASATTFFLRSNHPLLTRCADNAANPNAPECLCPQTKGSFDATCRPATGLSLSQAQLLEGPRQQFSALFNLLLPAVGPVKPGGGDAKSRDNVVLAWTFSIAHGPFAVFDPVSGRIPFPHDALIDQKTGKVNLPFDPKSGNAALYMGLNTLDGFSTTADETVPIDEADDNGGKPPVNAAPNQTVFLLNATSQSLQPTFSVRPELVNGGKDWDGLLAITPTRPLRPDKTQYVGVVTSDVADSKGRALKPSVLMALIKLGSPLADMAGHSMLPGTLTDAQASQLEPLRAAYAGLHLFEILSMPPFSIPKEKVAMVWTFKTQSMNDTLRGLAAYPKMAMIPTDVTILDAEPTGGALGPDVGQIVFGSMKTHVALGNGGAPGAVLDATGKDATIPFLLIAPASGQAKGIAIIQHGFTGWRGNIRFIAEAFAKAGWAVVGIDINFHGQRSACIKDAECDAGGKCMPSGVCSTKLAVKCTGDSQCAAMGSCDMKLGTCSTALAPQSSLCMTHLEGMAPVQECNPVSSGSAFLYFANPFSIRDNLRQHVLDLSQLERVITADGPGSLKAKLAALPAQILVDNSRTAYLGQSLGGIEGALFLSVSDKPLIGVLNVPGARLVDLLVKSPTFSPLVGPLLQAFMIAPDTQGYYQLLNIFRWITDPGDPINFGRYIQNEPLGDNKAKLVIVQEAGKDTVIPNEVTDALVTEIGLPLGPDNKAAVDATPLSKPQGGPMRVSTFFKDATHGFIFDPGPSPASTVAGQTQAVVWIDSNGMYITPPPGL